MTLKNRKKTKKELSQSNFSSHSIYEEDNNTIKKIYYQFNI